MSSESSSYTVSDDEKLWGFLAWLLSIVGAILVLLLKPSYRYAKYWANLSVSFFILVVIASIVGSVLSIVPLLGTVIQILIYISLLVVWIIGIVKVLNIEWWKPQIIYDLAKAIGVDKL